MSASSADKPFRLPFCAVVRNFKGRALAPVTRAQGVTWHVLGRTNIWGRYTGARDQVTIACPGHGGDPLGNRNKMETAMSQMNLSKHLGKL